MKPCFYLSCLLFCLLQFASCSSDELAIPEESGNVRMIEKVAFFIPEVEKDADTRNDWTLSGDVLDYSFATNDTVGVFPRKGDQVNFPLTNASGKSFTFDGGDWKLRDDGAYGFYMPFSKVNYFKNNKTIELNYEGQMQNGINDVSLLGRYDYMACGLQTPENGALSVHMSRLSSILRLYITIPKPDKFVSAAISVVNPSTSKKEKVFISKANLDISGVNPVVTTLETTDELFLQLKNFKTKTDYIEVELIMMASPVDLTQLINGGRRFMITLINSIGLTYEAYLQPSGPTAYTSNPYELVANKFRGYSATLPDVLSEPIYFADVNVENICLTYWGTPLPEFGDMMGVSYEAAAAVTSIDDEFISCQNIISFNEFRFFTGVTRIGDEAFYGCSNLESIVIPSSLTKMGWRAFQNCYSLTSITLLSNYPPTIDDGTIGRDIGITESCTIYVPAESVEKYKTHSQWHIYASQIKAINNN